MNPTPISTAEVKQLLQFAVAAVKAGERSQARDLLMQVVQLDERNTLAWLWLSQALDDPAEQQTCLENVLILDPGNKTAQRGLARLQQQPAVHPNGGSNRAASSGRYKRLSPQGGAKQPGRPKIALPEAPALPISAKIDPETSPDILSNEYICPHCAAPTYPGDKRCQNCRRVLRIHPPHQQKSSGLYKFLAWPQLRNRASNLLSFLRRGKKDRSR